MNNSKNIILTQAFTVNQWGLQATEVGGFYKSAVAPGNPGPPSANCQAPKDELGEKSAVGDYVHFLDNVSSASKSDICPWLSATCDQPGKGYFIWAACKNGHTFARKLICGKEWCPDCSQDGSLAHGRRIARWLPKVWQLESMGYFVFTLPEEIRGNYRSKAALAQLGHGVQELLKDFGFERGLRRWHWFGDKEPYRWHPHLNVLVPGVYIPDARLEALKRSYAGLLGVELADVHYHYRQTPGKKWHTLHYVTRATFKDYSWDTEEALELHKFRNMVVWGRGKWTGDPVWSLDQLHGKAKKQAETLNFEAISALENGICPVCGEPLKWSRALPVGLLEMVEKQDLGGGYYRLADRPPPGPGLPDQDKKKLQMRELQTFVRGLLYHAGKDAWRRHRAIAEEEWIEFLWRERFSGN